MTDDIVDEIHAVRRKIAEECDHDFKKLGDRYRKTQDEHPELMVTDVPETVPEPATNQDS